MVESKGLKISEDISALSTKQKEILRLLTDEFLTIKQISKRKSCSIQAVYKIVKKLKEKGYLGFNKNQPTFNPSDIRLHGQEFNIKIIYQDNRYQKSLTNSNVLFLDSNTIKLYKNSIEVYSGQSFIGNSPNAAESKSFEYWKHFFIRLEHELNIVILKQRSRNIKEVNHHFARGDSEICDNANKLKERIWIFAEEDGKLAFITDDSFGFREDETVHTITAKIDRSNIDKQINDWRLRNPMTNSQLGTLIGENASQIKILNETVNNTLINLPPILNDLKVQIASHLALIQEYRKENINWRTETYKKLKQQVKREQTSLEDYK